MERFELELNDVEHNSMRLKSGTRLRLWKTCMMWALVELREIGRIRKNVKKISETDSRL